MSKATAKTVDRAALLALWNSGVELNDIAAQLGAKRTTVHYWIRQAETQGLGTARRGPYIKPEDAPPLAAMWSHHTDETM